MPPKMNARHVFEEKPLTAQQGSSGISDFPEVLRTALQFFTVHAGVGSLLIPGHDINLDFEADTVGPLTRHAH